MGLAAVLALALLPAAPRPALAGIVGGRSQAIITGPGGGLAPQVRLFEPPEFAQGPSFFAYAQSYRGPVAVAAGDVNGDGTPDIVTGAGTAPRVKVFDGVSGEVISDFFAYNPTFGIGIFIAAGDVNGDGAAEIITGPSAGGLSIVKIFDGTTGTLQDSFLAYPPNFIGGVRVAAGDVNGDGHADIITGPGSGGAPVVRAFDGETQEQLLSFFAYNTSAIGGVFVASADVNGDGHADVITGPGRGPGPIVKIFDGTDASLIRTLFAYQTNFTQGVRVAAGDTDDEGHVDIVAAPAENFQPLIRVFNAETGAFERSFLAYSNRYTGGVFVGVLR